MFRRIRINSKSGSSCPYHAPSIFPKNTPSSFSFQTVAIMSLFIPGSCADRPHNALAGYGKTLWAHWNFIALHVWGNRSIRRQDAEKSRQPRSRIVQTLNGDPAASPTRRRAETWCSLFVAPCAPEGTPRAFARCGLAGQNF